MIRTMYQQYMSASQWLHHHTITVLWAIVLFAGLCMWHIIGQWIFPSDVAQASGPQVDMSISNTAIPSQAVPWSTITFFYYYQNESIDFNGNVPTTVDVTADIPVWMSFASANPSPDSVTSSSVQRNNVNLTDGTYGFVILQLKIDQNPPTTIIQTASLTMSDNTDPIQGNNQQSSTITILSPNQWPTDDVDLVVTKTAVQTWFVGQWITYTINYQNIGSTTATNVSVIDVIPAGTQFIDNGLIGITPSPSPTMITGTYNEIYIRNIGTLLPWQWASMTVSGIITPWLPDGFGLLNLVQITSDQNDSDSQNNFGYTLTNLIAQGADLVIQKSATANTVAIGQTFTYNMLVTNNGPDVATGVSITDSVPAWLTIIAATGATIAGNTYTWSIAQIPAYTSVLRSITVQATQAGIVTNAAQVYASTFDPILANNTSSFPVTVTQWSTSNTWSNNGWSTGNTWSNNGWSTSNTWSNSGWSTAPWSTSQPIFWSSQANQSQATWVQHGSAASPDGAKWCIYDDAQYLTKWPFADTIGHRWFPYIEMMRVSCIHRWPWGKKWLWIYEPNRSVTRAEVLKTVVKILGIQFGNFTIINEDLPYLGEKIFADTPNRFNYYAQYAYNQWLTEGLYTTDRQGNLYLNPDKEITRYEAIKVIMLAYNKIQQQYPSIVWSSVLGDIINPNDPYYSYVRQAEMLWFISWVPQVNGWYNFEGKRNITRAEFAKVVSLPFSDQLFDVSYIVENSSLYQKIVDWLEETTMDKMQFATIVLAEINAIPQEEFLYSFKVNKDIFMDVLTEKVLTPLLE